MEAGKMKTRKAAKLKMKITEVSKKRKKKMMEASKKKMTEMLQEKRMMKISEVAKKKMKFTEVAIWKKMSETGSPETRTPARDQFQAQEKDVIIPDDLISEILQRLPASSTGRFWSVSKPWLSITTCPSFARAHAQHNRAAHQSLVLQIAQPQLCFPRKLDFYLASVSNNPGFGTSLREWSEINMQKTFFIKSSCDGLLVICIWSRRYKMHVIVNPLTGRSINLPSPSVENDRDLTWHSIYFHCSTSKYRLLAMYSQGWNYVLTVGSNSWRRISAHRPAIPLHPHPVDVNGSLHWIAYTHKHPLPVDNQYESLCYTVMVFNKETEVFSLLSLPLSEKRDKRGGNLVDFHGELGFWVIDNNCTINLWIMKKYWIKRHSIICYAVHSCLYNPSFKYFGAWVLGTAISIGDEELLIEMNASSELHYLIRWNLNSGTYVVQSFSLYWLPYLPAYPYVESIADPTVLLESIDS